MEVRNVLTEPFGSVLTELVGSQHPTRSRLSTTVRVKTEESIDGVRAQDRGSKPAPRDLMGEYVKRAGLSADPEAGQEMAPRKSSPLARTLFLLSESNCLLQLIRCLHRKF